MNKLFSWQPNIAGIYIFSAACLRRYFLMKKTLELIKQLSLEEKVSMLSGDSEFYSGMHALLNEDSYHTKPFVAAANRRLGIPGIAFVDGPRGIVLKGGATCFPVTMARGATWNPQLEERIGEAIGKELRSLGGNLFGGVCVNLLRHPSWGVPKRHTVKIQFMSGFWVPL
ncbi:hypothetical protein GNX18_01375 [Microbulbifer sp. SH-1]|nr:hypothetical protein GNX18_01375 [Microbulbifer sp. SH-1]